MISDLKINIIIKFSGIFCLLRLRCVILINMKIYIWKLNSQVCLFLLFLCAIVFYFPSAICLNICPYFDVYVRTIITNEEIPLHIQTIYSEYKLKFLIDMRT